MHNASPQKGILQGWLCGKTNKIEFTAAQQKLAVSNLFKYSRTGLILGLLA